MSEIQPKNLSALLTYRGGGNPPSTHPQAAIANCFPGLEFDFRNIWKHVFVGVELHESDNFLVSVAPTSPAATAGLRAGDILVAVNGQKVETTVVGPRVSGGASETLAPAANLEWTNALAGLWNQAGQETQCRFRRRVSGEEITVTLAVRPLFDGPTLLEEQTTGPSAGPVAEPGALTQSLCSPWQADYRECGCYYWAASRPDFVNIESQGASMAGDNWMQKERGVTGQKAYQPDQPAHENPAVPSSQWTYEDLYRDWEQLRFQIGGKDEPTAS